MSFVIGIVGEKGSGKETFATLLAECVPGKTIAHVRSSDILAETLSNWSLPLTRHNLQHMAIVMDQGFGLGTLTVAVQKRIEKTLADIIIFDGVRWNTDEVMIRRFPTSVMVYVTAPLETRYDRTKLRKQKVGENTATLEQFKKEELALTELDIPKIGQAADFKIDNSDTVEAFKTKVQEFCTKYL